MEAAVNSKERAANKKRKMWKIRSGKYEEK
jgi:hypothetical protein